MAEWFAGDVVVGSIRLHYHRTGGSKPPVLLLHGLTDNGLCWTRLARALEADYDLIMPDARGHGLSDAPASGYSRAAHAADVAGLIAALGLNKPVLIGHSMGAANAATTAALYPERVGAVVLEDPPWREGPGPRGTPEGLAQWRAEAAANKAKSVEELIALCRARNPKWDEVEWLPWAHAKRQVSLNVFDFESSLRAPWQETAARVTCPALLITADVAAGAIVTPEVANEAARLMPKGRVVHIPGAGHNIRREQFARYLEAVRGFLSAL